MKLIKFLFLSSIFFTSVMSFSQATSAGSTLTVTDLSGSNVFWEYNFTATGGFISSFGAGVPLSTPVKIKLSSGSGYIPTFYAGDLNGNCDSFQIGSMNSTNTEFITTLNSCCPSIAEVKLSNNLKYAISLKCAPTSGTGTNCITYNISTNCNLYCIEFFLPSNSLTCRTKNYSVVIGFTNGTSTTIIVNFASNNTYFCFAKPISSIISSNFSTCSCGVSPLLKQINEVEKANLEEQNEIIVSPNPTNSLIKFSGKNLEKYNVSIFDSNGIEIVKNSKINSDFSLEKQTKGIYIYIIKDENGYYQQGKIIKE